jgi:putative oxidoreductase
MFRLQFLPKTDLAALILRISLGSMFFLHGIGKPMVVGMETISNNFIERGLPVWLAYATVPIEVIGGILLILGIYVRQVALVFIPLSIGIIMAHFKYGWVFSVQGGGWEYPQLILVATVIIFLIGGGKYAITK